MECYESAGIIKEKMDELCAMVPALERELDRRPGKTRQTKDYCVYMFKNGSYFDNISATEKARGKRRHGRELCFRTSSQIIIPHIVKLPCINCGIKRKGYVE